MKLQNYCYDYGARFYDPQIGRFTTIDPLSEDYDNQTPFLYAHNNPVRFTDYLGMGAQDEVDKDKDKKKKDEEAKKKEDEKKNETEEKKHEDVKKAEEDKSDKPTPDKFEILTDPEGMYYIDSNGKRVDLRPLEPGEDIITGMPPQIIGGPLRKGQSAIKIGKLLFNPKYLHKVLKPQILKASGNFVKVVGNNPDITVKGTRIVLKGARNSQYAGKTFETGMSIFDFIF